MLSIEDKNYIDHHYENIVKIMYNKNILKKKEEISNFILNCYPYSNSINDKAKLINKIMSINKNEGEGAKSKAKSKKRKRSKTKSKTKSKSKSKKIKSKIKTTA